MMSHSQEMPLSIKRNLISPAFSFLRFHAELNLTSTKLPFDMINLSLPNFINTTNITSRESFTVDVPFVIGSILRLFVYFLISWKEMFLIRGFDKLAF